MEEAGIALAIVGLGLKAIKQAARIYTGAAIDDASRSRVRQLHKALQTFIDQLRQAQDELEDLERRAKFLESTADTVSACTKFLARYDPQGKGPNRLQRGILNIDDSVICGLHTRISRHQGELAVFMLLDINRRNLQRRQTPPSNDTRQHESMSSPSESSLQTTHSRTRSYNIEIAPNTIVDTAGPSQAPSHQNSSLHVDSSQSGSGNSGSGGSIGSLVGSGYISLSLKYYKESWNFPFSSATSYYSPDLSSMCIGWCNPDLMFTLIHEVPLNEYGIPTTRLSHGKSREMGFLPINNTHYFKMIVNGEEKDVTDIPIYKVRKGTDSVQFQSLLRGRLLLGSYRVTDVEVGKSAGGEGEVKIWENPTDPRHPTVSFAHRPKRDLIHREFPIKCFDPDAEVHVRGGRLTIRKWGNKKSFSLSLSQARPLYEGNGKAIKNISAPSYVTFHFNSENDRKQFLQTSFEAHKTRSSQSEGGRPAQIQSMPSTLPVLATETEYPASTANGYIATTSTAAPTSMLTTQISTPVLPEHTPFDYIQWNPAQDEHETINPANYYNEEEYQGSRRL